MLSEHPSMLPSASQLRPELLELVQKMFLLHGKFKLSQFVQGENAPFNVLSLQSFLFQKGGKTLKLYLLSLLGIMSGTPGQCLYGSRFLDETNGQAIAFSLAALRHLSEASPQAIYWGYITARARRLEMPHTTIEELAFARLVCLIRIHAARDVDAVRSAWHGLGFHDREALTLVLIADGIRERAFVFTFLPLCFEQAIKNKAVGLYNMLVVLAELADRVTLYSRRSDMDSNKPILVDLQDFASFISVVKGTSVFCTCLERSKLNRTAGDKLHLSMTKTNWLFADDNDGQEISVTHLLRQIVRKQDMLERSMSSSTVKARLHQDPHLDGFVLDTSSIPAIASPCGSRDSAENSISCISYKCASYIVNV